MKKLIHILMILLTTQISFGQTNYIYFNTNGTIQNISDSATLTQGNDKLQMSNIVMSGIDWSVMQFGSFTGSVPDQLSDTNQLTNFIKIWPLTEEEYQDAKPPMLKAVENIYVDFLTNMWTGVLQQKGIISTNYVITVENTDSTQNMLYLMQLRALDFSTYNTFSGEFERLSNVITKMGGTMSRVTRHN